MFCFLVLARSVPSLQPVWQLADAGASCKQPAADLHVLLTGIDCYRAAGFKWDEAQAVQAAANCHEPVYNYPAAWLGLAHVPWFNSENLLGIATAFYFLFAATLWFLFRREPGGVQLLVLLVLVSPSTMLLCERANSDILMFCLVAWAALLVARNSAAAEGTAAGLLVCAGFLKLFPIAAAACLAATGARRSKWILTLCLLTFGLGSLAFYSDIARVRATTPEPTHHAYGAKVLIYEVLGKVDVQRHAESLEKFQHRLQQRQDYQQLVGWLGMGCQAAGLIVCGVCAALGTRFFRLREAVKGLVLGHKALYAAGAAIYVATFVLNNNWCYRLVFLVLTLPALVQLMVCAGAPAVRLVAGTLVVLLVLVCWATPVYEPLEYFLIHNLLHWMSAAGLSLVLGAILGSAARFGRPPQSDNANA